MDGDAMLLTIIVTFTAIVAQSISLIIWNMNVPEWFFSNAEAIVGTVLTFVLVGITAYYTYCVKIQTRLMQTNLEDISNKHEKDLKTFIKTVEDVEILLKKGRGGI